MTSVVFERDGSGSWKSFTLDRHTGFDEAGRDIVCAGISMLAINTVNSLEALLGEEILVETDDRDDGALLRCTFPHRPSEGASLLVDSLLLGIETARRQYGRQFVDYEIKEA